MKEYGFGIHLLDDLGERHLDILLTCPQEPDQPRDELVVDPLRHSALFIGLLERDAGALRGLILVMPLERVAAGKEVPADVAEGDFQRRRHLIWRIEPRAQSACVAASRALYPVLNFLGNLKYSFSASSCCCCCCCCGTCSCCTGTSSTLPSTQISSLSTVCSPRPCWRLGPCKGRW
ncbi:hypothetical protein DFH94DRAFT_194293 [Russula ochroleuca]|uniref:Uncharacterized protein n=1 Tax=Russula ochroleuca TaxID=152965 RepID=A0A9P5MMX2_9AGAM|nr:hypothetical protein DFH94DRAFT_194293 [Russula ochroleuca]